MNIDTITAILLGGILLALFNISVTLRAIFDLLSRWEKRREKHGHP